jgi:trimethylamine---corrinoid protein Co-methyltransferase
MKLPLLTVLSEQEIGRIHEASMRILNETGVMIANRRALELLERGGAHIDYARHMARFPAKLVESCLNTLPAAFALYSRDGRMAMTLGDGVSKCASGHNAIYVIDSTTNERRNSTVRDVEQFAIVSDKLADIDIVGVPVMPQDVTPQATLLYAVKALYENTAKPLFFSTESSAVNASVIRMMKAVAGMEDVSECPTAISQLSPTSPLFWEDGAAGALLDVAAEGVPLTLLPEPLTGISAPYTLAGLLTVHNAEVLSGIVLAQLMRPGCPVIYGSSWTTFDMKSMQAIIGGPETSLLRMAGSQMARHYRMPGHTTAPNSDSNAHDEQNAWEKSISNLSAIWAGNDVVMNSGMFATGLTISLEQLVMDDEMNGFIRRMARGIDVSADTIGADVIASVGPRGSFITEEHTVKFLRSGEFREAKASNTLLYAAWLKAGAPDSAKLANAKVLELLRDGAAHPLEPAVSEKFDRIIKDFEKALK